MRVNVKLYSGLKRFAPGEENVFTLDLLPGADVSGLFRALGIPADEPCFIMVDGRRREEKTPLSDGCTVVLFTPVDGG